MDQQQDPRKGSLLPSGDILTERYTRQIQWQIWRKQKGTALFVSPGLYEQWLSLGLMEPGVFLPYSDLWYAVETEEYGLISSADAGPFPLTGQQAMDIVRVFAYTRHAFPNACLAHALYLPQLPHLLFTEGSSDTAQDSLTLGRWLTGGMNIPLTDGERIRLYVPGVTETLFEEMLSLFSWTETPSEKIRAVETPARTVQQTPESPRSPRKDGPFQLPGRFELEKFFRERIIDVIDREEAYRRMGVPFPGPTLLAGPPGCGKTYAVEQLADYLGWPVYQVNSGTIGSSYIHETSRLIAQLFQQAMDNTPSIVIMDEMEAYLSSRSDTHGSNQYHVEEMAEFLRIFPELPKKRVLLFGMTNMPDRIDKAITRKGRFDNILEVSMPSEEEILALLETSLKDVPKESSLNLTAIARRLRGLPISDIVYTAREAGRLCVISSKDRMDQETLLRACRELENERKKNKPRKNIGFLPEDTIC